jgi:hypothetical protein
MTFSDDFRRRAVGLIHVYNVPIEHVLNLWDQRFALYVSGTLIFYAREGWKKTRSAEAYKMARRCT